MSEDELRRLDRIGAMSHPMPVARWEFDLDLGEQPAERLDSIVGVIRKIAEHSPRAWPPDLFWREALPDWMRRWLISLEEARRMMDATPRQNWDELPWGFGSWLEAIRDREWVWWGVARNDTTACVVVEVMDIPPRIDALKQIFLAAGADIVAERW